jgi:hypothetical protein
MCSTNVPMQHMGQDVPAWVEHLATTTGWNLHKYILCAFLSQICYNAQNQDWLLSEDLLSSLLSNLFIRYDWKS